MTDLSQENIWLNIDKPEGFSSAKAVAIVKRLTKAKKVGHGGTLDPFATGILPIALNKATKTSEKLMSARKKYFFRINFGEFRNTDDVEGEVVETSQKRPAANEITAILPFFIGNIIQTPSPFSAIKINGKRAYELARENIKFEMPKREITIYSLKLITLNSEFAELEAECSKGTYIRTLAHDICKKLGCCGYVAKLIRLNVGKFSYDKRISLDLLRMILFYDGSYLDGSMLSLHDVVD